MLYFSPHPKLILYTSRLLSLKAVASGAFSVWGAMQIPLQQILLSENFVRPLFENPYCKITLGFAALSVLSSAVSSAILSRTVVGLMIEGESLQIQTPRLFGAGFRRTLVDLASVKSLSPGSTLQGFRAPVGKVSTLKSFYLFPVEPLWTSGDPAALRHLLFKEFFRESEAVAALSAGSNFAASHSGLVEGIRGFGPFRPALYAHSKATQGNLIAVSQGVKSSAAVRSTEVQKSLPEGLTLKDGEVWAEFVLPNLPTLEERRSLEREKKQQKLYR